MSFISSSLYWGISKERKYFSAASASEQYAYWHNKPTRERTLAENVPERLARKQG
jgi:hypothetical protein